MKGALAAGTMMSAGSIPSKLFAGEFNIPDPLKRDNRRRIAPPIRSNYRKSYGGRTGGYRTNSYKRDVPARDQYKRKKTGRFSRVTRTSNRRKW